jgi:hypothetical protein
MAGRHASGRLYVQGLDELRRDLRGADRATKKRLQKANKTAAEVVAEATAVSFSADHPPISGQHEAAIRALATQGRAQVVAGGDRGPGFGGFNFGRTSDEPRKRQFPPKVEPDYFLYRAVEREQPRVIEAYAEALDELTRHDLGFR